MAGVPPQKAVMFKFLLIVQTLVAALLVGVILMQRSEGGGLGVGGSSSGFMTARGAADFLTRSTAILGGLFIVLSILLPAIAGASRELLRSNTSRPTQMAPAVPQQQGAPTPGTPTTQPSAQQQPAA